MLLIFSTWSSLCEAEINFEKMEHATLCPSLVVGAAHGSGTYGAFKEP